MRILIIEDDEPTSRQLSLLLEEEYQGTEIHVAATQNQAESLVETMAAKAEEYDVILLDSRLPADIGEAPVISGPTIFRNLRRSMKKSVVIHTTTFIHDREMMDLLLSEASQSPFAQRSAFISKNEINWPTKLLAVVSDISKVRHDEGGSALVPLELISSELLAKIAADPKILKCLSWREFEKVLAGILEQLEYEIELQRGTKDGGIDIFAIKRSGPFGSHRYLLQAKRWDKPVGVQPVRELMFLHSDHHVTKSCLATTSRFTEGAWALAERYQWELELKDYGRLLEWISLCKTKIFPGQGESSVSQLSRQERG